MKAELKRSIERELARRHLKRLCEIERPEWDWEAPHIRHLISAIDSDEPNIIIEFPIRHGKSETVTKRGAAQALLNSGRQVVIACHTQALANKFSRATRQIVGRFLDLKGEKSSVEEWWTPIESSLRAVGAGGAVIGEGFHDLFIDDPVKSREDAESEVMREKVWEWFTQDLWGRRQPGARVRIIMSRWHEDDLVGRIQESDFADEFKVVHVPAIAEENDPLGRQEGEALWPAQWPLEELAKNRTIMGEYAFHAQYQQRPSAKEGAMFYPDNILEEESAPDDIHYCRGWDFAATPGAGDFTEGWKMGGPDKHGLYHIVHAVWGQWDASEVERRLEEAAIEDGREVTIAIPQDPGQAGKSQIRTLTKLLDGYPVRWRPMSGAKEVRAQAFASAVNSGRVRVVKGPWVDRMKRQLRAFPMGVNDDIVDALVEAYEILSKSSGGKSKKKGKGGVPLI